MPFTSKAIFHQKLDISSEHLLRSALALELVPLTRLIQAVFQYGTVASKYRDASTL